MKYLKPFAAAAVLLLASCGGGDSGGPAIGGIQGTGRTVMSGAITGFGSVIVNGVKFNTSGAQIRIGDEAGTEAQLRIGQVVTIQGTVDAGGTTGTATQIAFAADVEGPVTQLDVAAGTFVVLGQTVRVTSATRFDNGFTPSDIRGLAEPGVIVEVSGFPTADGEISATRIEREDPGSDFEVKGVVQALDTNARRFRVNALTVDYSNATPQGTLAEGRLVEVKGRTLTAEGVLLATRVKASQGIDAARDDEVEIEGLVTRFVSNSDFDVSGQRVTTTTSTRFELKGVTLGPNVRVEVEGRMDANGVLVAREVEVEDEADLGAAVEGPVESLDSARGTLRVAGVSVTTSAATQYEDQSNLRTRPFGFADLRTGDFVEVRGNEAQGGGLDAVILERDDPDDEVSLQGVARNVSDPGFEILGVAVRVRAGTEFEDAADRPITRAQFFAIASGRVVKVEGTLSGATLFAEEVELED